MNVVNLLVFGDGNASFLLKLWKRFLKDYFKLRSAKHSKWNFYVLTFNHLITVERRLSELIETSDSSDNQ